MEVTNNGTTRHCTNCKRHIADFTKMKPAEIAAHIKNTMKPCGFMFPWQLDQVNAYIESNNPVKTSLLSRITKVAAIAGSPLLFGSAVAQNTQTTYTIEEVNGTEKPLATEILVKYANGKPFANGRFELYSGQIKMTDITSDINGKITLEHSRFAVHSILIIKHAESGSEITVTIKPEAVCVDWQLAVHEKVNVIAKHFDFHFKSSTRSKVLKNKIIRNAQVEIEFFDASNTCIKRVVKRTSAAGNLKLKSADVQKAEHVMLTITTQEGEKSVYFDKAAISSEQVNNVVVKYYNRNPLRRNHHGYYSRGKF